MKDKLLIFGPIGGAIAATACCWGPLLALTVGLGSFGAATLALGKYTPLLGGTAFLFLSLGFYRAYRPLPAECCDADGHGPPGLLRARRVQRASLWVSAVLVGSALTYHYTGFAWLTGRSPQTAVAHAQTVKWEVVGMTCEGCATTIQTALRAQQGVADAQVSYDEGQAIVQYDPDAVTPDKLKETINSLGFTVGDGDATSSITADAQSEDSQTGKESETDGTATGAD